MKFEHTFKAIQFIEKIQYSNSPEWSDLIEYIKSIDNYYYTEHEYNFVFKRILLTKDVIGFDQGSSLNFFEKDSNRLMYTMSLNAEKKEIETQFSYALFTELKKDLKITDRNILTHIIQKIFLKIYEGQTSYKVITIKYINL